MTQNPEWVLKFYGYFVSLPLVSLFVKGRHCSKGSLMGLSSVEALYLTFLWGKAGWLGLYSSGSIE